MQHLSIGSWFPPKKLPSEYVSSLQSLSKSTPLKLVPGLDLSLSVVSAVTNWAENKVFDKSKDWTPNESTATDLDQIATLENLLIENNSTKSDGLDIWSLVYDETTNHPIDDAINTQKTRNKPCGFLSGTVEKLQDITESTPLYYLPGLSKSLGVLSSVSNWADRKISFFTRQKSKDAEMDQTTCAVSCPSLDEQSENVDVPPPRPRERLLSISPFSDGKRAHSPSPIEPLVEQIDFHFDTENVAPQLDTEKVAPLLDIEKVAPESETEKVAPQLDTVPLLDIEKVAPQSETETHAPHLDIENVTPQFEEEFESVAINDETSTKSTPNILIEEPKDQDTKVVQIKDNNQTNRILENMNTTWVSSFAAKALYHGANISSKLICKSLRISDVVISTMEPVLLPFAKILFRNIVEQSKSPRLFEYRDGLIENIAKVAIRNRFTENFLEFKTKKFVGALEPRLSFYHIYHSGAQSESLSFSFSSCGNLVLYELGVAQALKEKLKQSILEQSAFLGSSSGSLPAMALALQLDIPRFSNELITLIAETSSSILGPLNGVSTRLRKLLNDHIEPNLEECSENLYISMTNLSGENKLVNNISNKTVLIEHIMGSCYIPLIFEEPSSIDGQMYIYSGISDPLPIKDELTITISPYFGASNICPQFPTFSRGEEFANQRNNLEQMYYDGYEDGVEWIKTMVSKGVLPSQILSK